MSRHYEGMSRRAFVDMRQAVTGHYFAAYFNRAKRMPSLDSVMRRLATPGEKPARQSVGAMIEAAKAWTRLLGGAVRKKGGGNA